jgi:hypothetical protein
MEVAASLGRSEEEQGAASVPSRGRRRGAPPLLCADASPSSALLRPPWPGSLALPAQISRAGSYGALRPKPAVLLAENRSGLSSSVGEGEALVENRCGPVVEVEELLAREICGGVEKREREWSGWVRGGSAAEPLGCSVPRTARRGGAAAFCSSGCSSCWSPYSSRGCCILGMQHAMHMLLESVLGMNYEYLLLPL